MKSASKRRKAHLMRWRRVGGKIKVSKIFVRRGDSIEWDARRTKKPMALFFLDHSLFGTHQIIVKGRKSKKSRISLRQRLGTYHYAVFFVQFGKFGEGSSPIIIVQP